MRVKSALFLITDGPIVSLTTFYVPTEGHNRYILSPSEVSPLSNRIKVFHLMITPFQPRVTWMMISDSTNDKHMSER